MYVFFDSELDDKKLDVDCVNFGITILGNAVKKNNLRNIFILSHKLIWAESNAKFKIVTNNSNDPKYNYSRYKFFLSKIDPVIRQLSINKNIYWFSGDVGANSSLPLFYYKNKRVHFIATGLGDNLEDLILNVNIKDSLVKISAYNLVNHNPIDLNKFNLLKWEEHYKTKNIIKRKIENLVNRNFIIGTIAGILLTIMLAISLKKLSIFFK